ncbi:MAG: site-specific integrase [Nitrososphaerota archaeon]
MRIDSESLRALERPKKANVRIDRAPSIGEVKTMVIAAQSKQLSVFIHLLATTGLRLSEALRLRVENFDFNAEPPILKIISAKTNLPREVPLTAELVSKLKEIMPGEGRIFSYNRRSAYNSIKYLLSRLSLRKRDASGRGYELHPHSFRKFYKTRLEEAGVNPLLIEMWMGHVTGVVHAYFKPNKKMSLRSGRRPRKH